MRPSTTVLLAGVGFLALPPPPAQGAPGRGAQAPPPEEDADLDEFEGERAEEGAPGPEDIDESDLAQKVLVVPLLGENADSTGVGLLLEGFLREKLARPGPLTVLGLDECPAVDDVAADLYFEGCPAGDELGCQFVIGELAGVDRVVGGSVSALDDGRYRVVVTILAVAAADVEFTYVLDLAAGEEDLFPRTVELALDRLRREELLAPFRDEQEQEEARRIALEAARDEDERLLVARMKVDPDARHLARARDAAKPVHRDVTQEEIDEIKAGEGVAREWEDLGITEKQYISYKNSRLEFDDWRWRWSGHRFQVLGTVQLGFIGGATGLRYYGAYLLDPGLSEVVDEYSWQRLEKGSSMTLGASFGFGILRNLDVELGGWWARSTVWVRIHSGDTVLQDGEYVPNPENHPPPEYSRQTVNLWGGELMLRYYVLTLPIVRPTVGAGLGWATFPSLYNDPNVPDDEEDPVPPIRGWYITYRQVTDFGIQVEPGLHVDIGRHLGVFLRVPISFGLNPARKQTSGDFPPPIIPNPDEPGSPPFGTIRVLVGVQGRILGMPVQPKVGPADDVLEEDRDEPARKGRARGREKDDG